MTKQKKDISTRDDIELLVDEFYKQVLVNPVIGHFFTEVVELDWEKHIPVMYNFWETVLLKKATYSGNPIRKHLVLDQKTALKEAHLTEWLRLWKKTLETHFAGETASEAYKRADTIGRLMLYKVEQSRNPDFLQ